ncbi:MAG: hypothetical protein L6R43_16060 [Planctomycetes bacterium]|nr:hypothetical protein [Planctomycetota bacterium]
MTARTRPLPAAAAPAAALLLLAAQAGTAAGDEFLPREGPPFEAQVLRTFRREDGTPDRWEVRTLSGRRTVLASEIREVRPRPADAPPYPWEDFEARLAFEDPAHGELLLALGLEARGKGMEAEARRAFRKALSGDPEGRTAAGARARTLLGHVKVDGRWTVPPGVERAPEERGEPAAAEGPSPLEKVLGRMLARRRSENFLLESDWLDQPSLGRYLDTLERAREAALAFLAEPPPVGGTRVVYRLLREREDYLRALDALVAPAMAAGDGNGEAARTLRLYRAGHLARTPGEPTCIAWRTSEDDVEDRAFLAHHAVHEVWRTTVPVGAREPDWLQEAFAYSVLNDLFPDDPCWCVSTGYGREDRVPPAWRNTRTWGAAARALAASGKALAFQDLAVMDLNSLGFDALVQAWSVLGVLREKDGNGTRAFLRKVRRGGEQFAALKETLRMDPGDVDRLWRSEMLKRR